MPNSLMIQGSYSKFEPNNQGVTTTVIIGKEKWISDYIINLDKNEPKCSVDTINFRECFEMHIEVEIINREGQDGFNVYYRFDLHSNPYLTESDIKNSFKNHALYFNERQLFKKTFIKMFKHHEKFKIEKLRFHKGNSDFLWLFRVDTYYENISDWKVDFTRLIGEFEQLGEVAFEYFINWPLT